MTLTEGEKHDLSKHDAVAFEAAEGTEGEETCLAEDSFPVRRVVTPTSFTIPRTPALGGAFAGGRFRQVRPHLHNDVYTSMVGRGIIHNRHTPDSLAQVKKPQTLAFKPMAQAREELLSLPTDFGKASLSRQLTLHACFETLGRFRREKGRAPKPGSAKDAKAFGKMVKACALLETVADAQHAAAAAARKKKKGKAKAKSPEPVEVDERVAEVFARTCRGALAPMCSVVGGTAAQEVLKACTGTFVPLRQYLFFDAVEALPEKLPTENDCRCVVYMHMWGCGRGTQVYIECPS